MSLLQEYTERPFVYNSERSDILFKEYGRHIEGLVTHILEEDDFQVRTEKAKLIIELMRQLNPVLKDAPDAHQKIWDHLHIMADFQLDVDCPYPVPSKEDLYRQPDPIKYSQKEVKYKHYGRHIELLIEQAEKMEDTEERYSTALHIARLMKSFYAEWNKESIEDEVIVHQLREMSKGILNLNIEKVKSEDLLDIKNRKTTSSISNTPRSSNNQNSSKRSGATQRRDKDNRRSKRRR